jgi:hypothetical protein
MLCKVDGFIAEFGEKKTNYKGISMSVYIPGVQIKWYK